MNLAIGTSVIQQNCFAFPKCIFSLSLRLSLLSCTLQLSSALSIFLLPLLVNHRPLSPSSYIRYAILRYHLQIMQLSLGQTLDNSESYGIGHWCGDERSISQVRMASRSIRMRTSRPTQCEGHVWHGPSLGTCSDYASCKELIYCLGRLAVSFSFCYCKKNTYIMHPAIRRIIIHIRR